MKFKSKAKTLKTIKLKKSIIPDLEIFKCSDFIKNKNKIRKNSSNINNVYILINNQNLISYFFIITKINYNRI